ncbi:MAG: CHRD domain-containing protein [Nitrososphaerales archaeon]|nr:CHRD domain-containing protein [Nitrososphaerales archaeon]
MVNYRTASAILVALTVIFAGSTAYLVTSPVTKTQTTTSTTTQTTTQTATTTATTTLTTTAPQSNTFTAALGNFEVPKASGSTAAGTATVTLSADGTTLHFVVIVNGITNVTLSHIHLGNSSTAGPVVVPFFLGPTKTGSFSGILAQGDVTAASFTGPLAGKSMADLITNMRNGLCYVNVHTTAFPGGEIRGQLHA